MTVFLSKPQADAVWKSGNDILPRCPQVLTPSAKLFGEWRSGDEVCEIWRCEPLDVSNAKIPKNVVSRRHRFLTNDVAKASYESVLECQPRKCGEDRLLFLPRDAIKTGAKDIHRDS